MGAEPAYTSAHDELYGPQTRDSRITHGNPETRVDRVLQASDHFGSTTPGSIAKADYKPPSVKAYSSLDKNLHATKSKFLRESHFKFACSGPQKLASTTQSDFQALTGSRSKPENVTSSNIPMLSRDIREKCHRDTTRSSYSEHFNGLDEAAYTLASSTFRDANSKYLKATHYALGSDAPVKASETKSSYLLKTKPEHIICKQDRSKSHIMQEDQNNVKGVPKTTSQSDFLIPKRDTKSTAAQQKIENANFLKSTHFSFGNEKNDDEATIYDCAYNTEDTNGTRSSSFKEQLMRSDVMHKEDDPTKNSTLHRDTYKYIQLPPTRSTAKTGSFYKSSLCMGNIENASGDRKGTVTSDDYKNRGGVIENKRLDLKQYRLFNDSRPNNQSTTTQDSFQPHKITHVKKTIEVPSLQKTHLVLGSDNPKWLSEIKSNYPRYLKEQRVNEIKTTSKYNHVTPDQDDAPVGGMPLTSIQRLDFVPIDSERIRLEELRNQRNARTISRTSGTHYFHLDYDQEKMTSTTRADFIPPEVALISTKKRE